MWSPAAVEQGVVYRAAGVALRSTATIVRQHPCAWLPLYATAELKHCAATGSPHHRRATAQYLQQPPALNIPAAQNNTDIAVGKPFTFLQ
jgi:hypothetical protein